MKRMVLWVACAAFMVGCSSKEDAPVGDGSAAAPADASVAMYDRMNVLLESGETNAAIEMMQDALGDPTLEGQRPWLFQNILDVMISAGRVDDAREVMLAGLAENAEYARNGFGLIYRHYVESGDNEGRLEWTGALVDAGLSGRMKLYAYAWRLVTIYEVQGVEETLAYLPACIEEFSGSEGRVVLRGVMDRVLSHGDVADTEKFLDRIEALAEGDDALLSMTQVFRNQLLISRGMWDEADAQLQSAASSMTDEDLAHALQSFSQQAQEQGHEALVAGVAEFVLDTVKGKPQSRELAATVWMNGAKADGTTVRMDRLEKLLELGIPTDGLVRIYRANFYDILNGGVSADIERLMNLGDRLLGKLGPMDDEQGIRMLQLDGSFLTEDYARAIQLLEKGIPGRDKAWQEMALNKIKAHQALREGRPEEAIERFRVFMKSVEGWENAERDPATGVLHTKEMTLGRNALRIGNIYALMGKPEEAVRAFEEAADDFTRAISTVEPGSEEYALIKAEMDKIPSGK